MTTIVFSTVGSMVGGPIGGAIGALVGRQVDGALLGIPNRQGPRLRELGVTTSTYGEVLPRHYGRMRVAGSVIWATDLVEHSDTEGGGKGSPSLTTYTYSASFAVALASRPILSVGRIWADGRLLRGAAGDLKVGGALRIHTGRGDQPADPLLAADAGADRCPAYRGLAYAVFEDLDLSEFYNRVPNLTFEVIADEAFDLGTLVGDVLDDADAAAALDGVAGWSCEGSLAEALDMLDAVVPMEAYAAGDRLIIKPARLQTEAVALPEPALNVTDDGFGGQSGFARRRDPVIVQPPMALRYYDTARDYLPGLQRATGRPIVGKPRTLELPAALDPVAARALIERTLRRGDWSRDRVSWRTADLDTRIGPGTVASLPGIAGLWRVIAWEWRDGGVELALARVFPEAGGVDAAPGPGDAGQFNPPADHATGETVLAAFEMPRLVPPAPGESASLFAAASSPSPYWAGAALYADPGTGAMLPLGPSGRNRCMIGTMLDVLPVASPHIVDRASSVTVQLVGEDLALSDMSLAQLALGGNLALIGDEAIQFGRAIPLGAGVWRLEMLLRGRCGTEAAIGGHGSSERFVLIDGRTTPVDAGRVGSSAEAAILALGRADADPVAAHIAARGVSLRPPAPVHGRARVLPDGTTRLSWVRRARGAWAWQDGVDVPLVEDRERYLVTLGPVAAPVRLWWSEVPWLDLSAAVLASLTALAVGQPIVVRQQGNQALSDPLTLLQL
ncbi:phage tail protein [Novosphingobium colocasiae]|uniref:Tip attachment protein J domain-containing protein n=1 Tax=Novosphingobium colocasiae TaxID=1256513 RepID=A0A918PCJ2_9SPHN|nr:phage tail protein [Novosphingobium colocasiae]GGY99660.1 hypothetical protein GCM10011614_13280 [Novosphingobium colocasiae]